MLSYVCKCVELHDYAVYDELWMTMYNYVPLCAMMVVLESLMMSYLVLCMIMGYHVHLMVGLYTLTMSYVCDVMNCMVMLYYVELRINM